MYSMGGITDPLVLKGIALRVLRQLVAIQTDANILKAAYGQMLQLLSADCLTGAPPGMVEFFGTAGIGAKPEGDCGGCDTGEMKRREDEGVEGQLERLRSHHSDAMPCAKPNALQKLSVTEQCTGEGEVAAEGRRSKSGHSTTSLADAPSSGAAVTLSHALSGPPLASHQSEVPFAIRAAPLRAGSSAAVLPPPSRTTSTEAPQTAGLSLPQQNQPTAPHPATFSPSQTRGFATADALSRAGTGVAKSAELEVEVRVLRQRLQAAAQSFSVKEAALRREISHLRSSLGDSNGMGVAEVTQASNKEFLDGDRSFRPCEGRGERDGKDGVQGEGVASSAGKGALLSETVSGIETGVSVRECLTDEPGSPEAEREGGTSQQREGLLEIHESQETAKGCSPENDAEYWKVQTSQLHLKSCAAVSQRRFSCHREQCSKDEPSIFCCISLSLTDFVLQRLMRGIPLTLRASLCPLRAIEVAFRKWSFVGADG
jgi:hypothetical protein